MKTSEDERTVGFPSHLVPPEKKDEKWCKQYCMAFHGEYRSASGLTDSLFRHQTHNYDRWRKYAKGNQNTDQYKELLSIKKNKGKRNLSYRNLDYSILKVAPKLKQALLGKILNRNYSTYIKTVDPHSINKERQAKFELQEYVINRQDRMALEAISNIKLPVPGGDPANMPENLNEVEPHLKEMNYKHGLAAEMQDYIDLCFAINDYNQIKEECGSDLIDTGVFAIRAYIDSNGFIRLRRAIPENMVVNKCQHNNFKDKIRVGEYIQMTIADLKQRVGYRDGWTEETYIDIANRVTGNNGKYSANMIGFSGTDDTYPWDHEKVTVLEATWYSVDNYVKMVKRNPSGNKKMYDKPFGYKPFSGEKKRPESISQERWSNGMDRRTGTFSGLSDGEYKEMFKGDREIIRNEIKNVYQCSWVVDTDYVFDWGLVTDMYRALSNLADVEMGWIIQTSDFESTIARIEAALDNIQIQWLQFQSHAAASKPKGVAIEKNALAKASMGGKGGENFNPKEAIKMYAETGNFIYDGYDFDARPLNQIPFQELNGGMSEAAAQHFEMIFREIELIRFMLGLNEVTDATGPDPKLPVGIGDMITSETDNALTVLHKAFQRGIKDTAKRVIDMIPIAIDRGMHKGLIEALGTDTYSFFRSNKDLNLAEFGVEVELGIDAQMRERMFQIAMASAQKGELFDEDALYVLGEDNLWRARQYMKKRRNEVRRQRMEETQAANQGKAQADQQSAMATAEMNLQKLREESALKIQLEDVQHQNRMRELQFKLQGDIMLKKIEGQQGLKEIDAKTSGSLLEIDQKGDIDEDLKRMEIEAKKIEAANKENKPSADK